MSIVRNNTVIMWKGFAFPMSIETFKMREEAKVATYEYAWRNGAEQERVLNYRVFNISGIFTLDSWDKDPSFYVQKLRELNTNEPWVLGHPVFWTYRVICKSLDIEQSGTELEHAPWISQAGRYLNNSGINMSWWGWVLLQSEVKSQSAKVAFSQRAVPNYKFSLEFWESIPPTAASLQSQLSKLFPATSVKPTNDNYQTSTKYKTVMELYWALVNGQISPWIDPIRNAEWLAYDYNFRKEAYDLWIADPKGTKQSQNTTGTSKISTAKSQNVYTVTTGDTALKIAKKLSTTPEALFQANSWKKVRSTPMGADGLYWKRISIIYPWDTLIIP